VLTEPVALTVASETSLLLQVPPVVGSLRLIAAPAHAVAPPTIAATVGEAMIVTVVLAVVVQPPVVLLKVIVALPVATPVTAPVVALTVAIAVLLLLHVPPVDVSVRVAVAPLQMLEGPLIADTTGSGLTLISLVTVVVAHGLLTL